MKKLIIMILSFIIIFTTLSCDTGKGENNMMKSANKNNQVIISLQIGDTKINATMLDNETTQDFLTLLPMTIAMKDLYASEKYAELPVKLSDVGTSRKNYEIGDISYWSPGNCLVIYYKQTGEVINGLQTMGKINDELEIFEKYKGSVVVIITIEN